MKSLIFKTSRIDLFLIINVHKKPTVDMKTKFTESSIVWSLKEYGDGIKFDNSCSLLVFKCDTLCKKEEDEFGNIFS